MLLERIQQGRCEPEIPAHKLAGILRSVHPCEVEHEVRLRTPEVQFLGRGIEIVLVNFRDGDAVVAGFAVLDILQLCAEVSAYEAFGSGNKYLHKTVVVALASN